MWTFIADLLAKLGTLLLQFAVKWKEDHPDEAKVIEATDKDKDKWNQAVDFIDKYKAGSKSE